MNDLGYITVESDDLLRWQMFFWELISFRWDLAKKKKNQADLNMF